jgi:hypothetical protein
LTPLRIWLFFRFFRLLADTNLPPGSFEDLAAFLAASDWMALFEASFWRFRLSRGACFDFALARGDEDDGLDRLDGEVSRGCASLGGRGRDLPASPSKSMTKVSQPSRLTTSRTRNAVAFSSSQYRATPSDFEASPHLPATLFVTTFDLFLATPNLFAAAFFVAKA